MSGFVFAATTVEPRLSGPPLSGTSIIRLGSFLVIRSENGGVPQTRMRVAAVTMETCLLIFCACADNHVALLFINKVGGSRRGLSIRLSGVFTYPACFWNQGVRIIEVLLYITIAQGYKTFLLACDCLCIINYRRSEKSTGTEMRSPPPVIYEEILDPLAQKNLAYSHVQQLQAPLEQRGPVYEEPEDIKPDPHTQGNLAYGHVQFH